MVTEKIEMSLEQYLTDGHQKKVDEFTVRILQFEPLTFYIRPTNQNGETINFAVNGDVTECVSERIVSA